MNYRIPRHSDDFVIDCFVRVARTTKLPKWSINIQYHFPAGNHSITETIPESQEGDWRAILESKPLTREASKGKIVGAKRIVLIQSAVGEVFSVDRGDLSQPSDSAGIVVSGHSQVPPEELSRRAGIGRELYELLLGVSGRSPVSAVIGDELGRFVESRDAGLARLEELYARFTEDLVTYRKEIDDALAAGRQKNAEELTSEREKLGQEIDGKAQALREREEALTKRLQEIDDRASHHVRRELRGSMMQELKGRSEKFELTPGTRKLRQPIAATLAVLSSGLLAGAIYYGYLLNEVIATKEFSSTGFAYLAAKQLLFSAGFFSVVWYAIKWNDKWFREHAEEEFRAKTLQLDIERASWVVETALAWKQERGTDIPPGILDRISQNLFERSKNAPTESGAITICDLLGSASKVKARLGDQAEIEFDRKGAQRLSASASE